MLRKSLVWSSLTCRMKWRHEARIEKEQAASKEKAARQAQIKLSVSWDGLWDEGNCFVSTFLLVKLLICLCFSSGMAQLSVHDASISPWCLCACLEYTVDCYRQLGRGEAREAETIGKGCGGPCSLNFRHRGPIAGMDSVLTWTVPLLCCETLSFWFSMFNLVVCCRASHRSYPK